MQWGPPIAEAWAKRRYEKHFVSKLTDADGEQQETQHWLETAVDCAYLTPTEAQQLLATCQRIGRPIRHDRQIGPILPQPSLREPPADYFIHPKRLTAVHRLPITDYRLPSHY
ncbi:MAG: four helix bundle protein [Chloroflexota bacterium]